MLQIGALILGCTIYFFYTSRRSLQQTLQQGGHLPQQRPPRKSLVERFVMKGEVMRHAPLPVIRPSEVAWPDPLAAKGYPQNVVPELPLAPAAAKKKTPSDSGITLTTLLQRIEQLEAQAGNRPAGDNLHLRIEELEAALAEKTSALNQARQQENIAVQMSSRLEEVFRDFEQLQKKMAGLETQAAQAAEQAIELEELQRAYSVMQKDLVRKQDKLEELVLENQRLHAELAAAAQKLAAADQQRQQLSARSRLVQDLQMDVEAMSEGQSRLQQQLRRISELEMMLEQFGERK